MNIAQLSATRILMGITSLASYQINEANSKRLDRLKHTLGAVIFAFGLVFVPRSVDGLRIPE